MFAEISYSKSERKNNFMGKREGENKYSVELLASISILMSIITGKIRHWNQVP